MPYLKRWKTRRDVEWLLCCTLREDLLEEIQHLAKANKFDYLIIGPQAFQNPCQLRSLTLMKALHSKTSLSSIWSLLLDTFNFSKDFKSTEILTDREEFLNEEDERPFPLYLLTNWIRDVIIMNKIDECRGRYLQNWADHSLSIPTQKLLEPTTASDLKEIINTGLFDFEKASKSHSGSKLSSVKKAVNQTSIIFILLLHSETPFHPQRFWPGQW